jgi:hypothetical protein
MKKQIALFVSIACGVAFYFGAYFGFNSVDLINAAQAASRPKEVLYVGDSVIKASSKCDKDKRSIAEMVSAMTGKSSNDLSRGGMRIDEGIEIAKINASNTSPEIVILPLAVTTHLLAAKEQLIGREAWFKLLLQKREMRVDLEATEYKGRQFGDYASFSKVFFPAEQKAQGCGIESLADREFVEFMYWRNFVRDPDFDSGAKLWIEEIKKIEKYTQRLIVVLMPFNHHKVEEYFGESERARIQASVDNVATTLQAAGIETLNLSNKLESGHFTDVYCACGHLNERGRKKVADALANKMLKK